jgi:predicted ATPase
MAEAGIGKSRLLYEFRKAVSSEDVTFLEGKCLSYSRDVAYHLYRDVLKANFDLREGDGDSVIREKIKKGLQILGVDVSIELPYFLELLSVKDSGIDEIAMSPEAKKIRIMEALKQIALKGSEIRPLILAFEDLHWIDKSSEDVLKYVLESLPGARVLTIFTYRPEFVHTWGAKSYHNQITLNRLSNKQWAFSKKWTHRTAKLYEVTGGVPLWENGLTKSLKSKRCGWRRSQAAPNPKSSAILASAKELSVAGNASCAKTATRRFRAKVASNLTMTKCGGSNVKMSACVGSAIS